MQLNMVLREKLNKMEEGFKFFTEKFESDDDYEFDISGLATFISKCKVVIFDEENND